MNLIDSKDKQIQQLLSKINELTSIILNLKKENKFLLKRINFLKSENNIYHIEEELKNKL